MFKLKIKIFNATVFEMKFSTPSEQTAIDSWNRLSRMLDDEDSKNNGVMLPDLSVIDDVNILEDMLDAALDARDFETSELIRKRINQLY